MFDARTGRALWERRHSFARFAGSKDILLHQEDDSKPIEFLDARTGVRQAVAPNNFDYRSATVTLTPDARHVAIHGWLTRNRETYFWEDWLEQWWPEVFFADRPAVLVLELPTGREMFRASKWANWNYVLSDDASTLVIVDQQEGNADNRCIIWIWDVHPTKAWLWAIGAVVATGLGWSALRRAWGKLTGRKSASQRTTLASASA